MPIDNLIASLFQDPPAFSLVTGVGIGQPPDVQPEQPVAVADVLPVKPPAGAILPDQPPADNLAVGPPVQPPVVAPPVQPAKTPVDAPAATPEILVFVEPAADCELQALWEQIQSKIPGEPFRLLITGRFVGLQATTGHSVSIYAPRRYNVPPVSAGTAGAIVDAGGKKYIIGSNHVLAFNGRALPDTAVAAPGTLDDRKGGVVIGRRSF